MKLTFDDFVNGIIQILGLLLARLDRYLDLLYDKFLSILTQPQRRQLTHVGLRVFQTQIVIVLGASDELFFQL